MNIKNPEKIIRIATIGTLSFMVCWGLVQVVAEIRPFWVDEWRIIYNLKFKTAAQLWGPLDFMQQFPRAYLIPVKWFTSRFGYSYTSLRLPSFVVGTAVILFSYHLMNRIYGRDHFARFLFVLVLISCSTFTDYFVEIKQYTMELLLSLVALWQLIELLRIDNTSSLHKLRYLLLCISLLVTPFFSYSYPVAIAPVFMVLLVQSVFFLKDEGRPAGKRKLLLLKWFPLLLCIVGTSVFYKVDVAQLLRDKDMHKFWGHLLMDRGFSWRSFFTNCYMLFAEVGSGFVFWYLFGIFGILSFAFGIRSAVNSRYSLSDNSVFIRLYCVGLLVFAIALFAAGKLPLGEPRLNAFTVPAISMLLIGFFDFLAQKGAKGRFAKIMVSIFYVGLIGNIYTTFFASFTGEAYARKMDIYRATQTAITIAQDKKLPIFVTPGVAYPYEKTKNLPYETTVPGDWVLKTFPAYKVADSIPVFAVNDLRDVKEAISHLPAIETSAVVGDGISYKIYTK
jgi:hypothetical protein